MDFCQKGSTSAKVNPARCETTLNNHLSTQSECVNVDNGGAILVTRWQMKQQVLNAVDANARQFFLESRPYPFELLKRDR